MPRRPEYPGFCGQHISRDLFLHKLIKGLVLVIGPDHVITVRPDAAKIIQMQPVSIPVTRYVEPVVGAMLAIARTREQAVHYFLIRIRGPSAINAETSSGVGRQAGQVVSDASNQRGPIGLSEGRNPSFSSRLRMKLSIGFRAQCDLSWLESLAVLAAGTTSVPRKPLLLSPIGATALSAPASGFGGLLEEAFALSGSCRLDPPHQRTLIRITGNDRRTVLLVGCEGELSRSSRSPLSVLRDPAMACITVFRKNGLDGLVERQSSIACGRRAVNHPPRR